MADHAALRPDFPPWMARVAAIPAVLIALVSVLGVLGTPEVAPVAVAVTLALVPWILDLAGVGLAPWLFSLLVLAPMAVLNLAGHAFGVDLSGDGHSQFTLMFGVWLVGETAAVARRSELAGTAAAVLAIIVGRSWVEPEFGHAWVFWTGGAGIALVTGFLLRMQQRTLSELRSAQAALAEEAVQRERQAIAREVHDVVAHTMTVTLMHLQAARRALERGSSGARDALVEAETLARRSLVDLRRTVGLLRTEDDRPETRALPEAGDIPELVAAYRAAGLEVRATIDADLAPLGPAVGLTLYRLVQETLANAAAHAEPATVDLTIRAEGPDLVVEASNPHPAAASRPADVRGAGRGGLGLVGMRERVRLVGGQLDAGPHGDRWRLAARLPVRAPATPPTEAVR